MKKLLNSIKNWWERVTGKAIEIMRPNAKAAYTLVNAIKKIVESPALSAIVLLTKTKADDAALAAARAILPQIAEKLLVADIIMSHPTPSQIIEALIDYLRKQNKDVRAAFYIVLAGKINEALADGKMTLAEAVSIGQIIFEETQNE
jgi:fatty acid-binding protein DegV